MRSDTNCTLVQSSDFSCGCRHLSKLESVVRSIWAHKLVLSQPKRRKRGGPTCESVPAAVELVKIHHDAVLIRYNSSVKALDSLQPLLQPLLQA